jgi:hypothetical protein
MRPLLYRSATVHNNERLASPPGDAGTKVRRSARFHFGAAGGPRPLVGQMTSPQAALPEARLYTIPPSADHARRQ